MENSSVKKNGIYKHYKGPLYKVLDVVRHSESLEELVLYDCLYDNKLSKTWVRPMDNFCGEIEIDGKRQPRFALQEETELSVD